MPCPPNTHSDYEELQLLLFFHHLQVLVIIDVKPKDLGLPTEAYISVEEIHDVSKNCSKEIQSCLKNEFQFKSEFEVLYTRANFYF